MATLDWSQCPAVESIPGKVSGAWVFRGTRMPVSTVFENLQDMNVDELIEEFGVTRERLMRTLQEVRSVLKRAITRAQARDKVKRNVVLLCEIPQGRQGRPSKSLTLPQAESLLDAARVGHSGSTTTETIYRKQIRPVLVRGAESMDVIFPIERRDA